jgi:hypothetical protein
MNYQWIKELAAKTGRSIPTLLALSRGNDPFFAGCEAQKRDAEWFLGVWERFGFGSGVHLRRIHYRIVSDREPTLRPNGMPYKNTLECWNDLGDASKAARYLRLVDPAAFIDRRNPDPKIFATSRNEPVVPGCYIDEPDWSLPSIEIQLEPRLSLPRPVVDGYDYELADQRYHLGLWIEKSTMDDVLEPLCRRYGMDLVTGVGFQSITSVITLLRQRVMKHGKPTRIFYISDFDPAGEQMPVATARQIEYWLNEYAPGMDIKLTPVVLTKEQVIRYGLPRTPIKESDLRRKGFEDRHGEGAVELDALEALHPGELARIVTDAIRPYFDDKLWERLQEAGDEADELAEAEWEAMIEEETEQLEELRVEAEAISEKYSKRATKLKAEWDRALEPLKERLDLVRHAIQDKAAEFHVDLPERPEAAESDADESGWLFDSSRPYLEQIEAYCKYKGTSEEE